MSNIGRTIQDGFCNGFFGRQYSLKGARIEAEAYDYLVIRTEDGTPFFAYFQEGADKQEYIDEWCAAKPYED